MAVWVRSLVPNEKKSAWRAIRSAHPEIYEMQVRGIVRAARAVRERSGEAPKVEIMIPLVAYERELELTRARVLEIARRRASPMAATSVWVR